MFFCPASKLNLPFSRFQIEATSLFCQLITSSTPEIAKGYVSAYQLSDELTAFMPSLLAGEPDAGVINAYIQKQNGEIDTADSVLEANVLAMILLRLYDLTENSETRSLIMELAFTLPDDM